ncbi:MAG: hypothetical protein AAFN77_10315 [Planctomycetota bacterium]
MIINDFVILAAVNYAYVGIVALVVIAVIVLAAISSKTWHWSHIVFLSLTAIATGFAANGMAVVFEQRTKAMKQYETQLTNADRNEKELEEATTGVGLSDSYDPGTLRYVDEQLSRALIGRGRVWTGGSPELVDLQKREFKYRFAQARVLPDEGSPEANLVRLKDYKLYAYAEKTQNGTNYPAKFVGEFRVESETADELTLTLLNFGDPSEARQPAGTWTLFEKAPLDRRGVFRDAIITKADATTAEQLPEYHQLKEMFTNDNVPLDISLFRKVLKRDYLRSTQMGFNLDNSGDQVAYQELVDRFSFDGLNLEEINAWTASQPDRVEPKKFSPQTREIFYKLKFKKDTNQTDNPPIKVDDTGSVETDGFFTSSGAAVVNEYKNNSDIEFKAGDEIYVDKHSASGYKRGADVNDFPPFYKPEFEDDENGRVSLIGEYYFRLVRDYPYEFSEIRIQQEQMAKDLVRIQESNKVQAKANSDAKKQQEVRVVLIGEAEVDKESLQADLNSITSLRSEKENQLDQRQQKIAELEQEIDTNYRRLRQIILQLSQQAFASR